LPSVQRTSWLNRLYKSRTKTGIVGYGSDQGQCRRDEHQNNVQYIDESIIY